MSIQTTVLGLNPRKLATAASNLLLASLYLLFFVVHVRAFMDEPRLSLVLLCAFELIVAVFVIIRSDAIRTWHSWQTWLTTMLGTFGSLLLRPVDGASDLLLGQGLQVLGVTLQLIALFSLNRSFGLLPAERGIKTGGMYRLVRHPLYFSYLVTFLGYVINNPSLYNIGVLVVTEVFQILRILYEERFLAENEAYRSYMKTTRYRLIPLVW